MSTAKTSRCVAASRGVPVRSAVLCCARCAALSAACCVRTEHERCIERRCQSAIRIIGHLNTTTHSGGAAVSGEHSVESNRSRGRRDKSCACAAPALPSLCRVAVYVTW